MENTAKRNDIRFFLSLLHSKPGRYFCLSVLFFPLLIHVSALFFFSYPIKTGTLFSASPAYMTAEKAAKALTYKLRGGESLPRLAQAEKFLEPLIYLHPDIRAAFIVDAKKQILFAVPTAFQDTDLEKIEKASGSMQLVSAPIQDADRMESGRLLILTEMKTNDHIGNFLHHINRFIFAMDLIAILGGSICFLVFLQRSKETQNDETVPLYKKKGDRFLWAALLLLIGGTFFYAQRDLTERLIPQAKRYGNFQAHITAWELKQLLEKNVPLLRLNDKEALFEEKRTANPRLTYLLLTDTTGHIQIKSGRPENILIYTKEGRPVPRNGYMTFSAPVHVNGKAHGWVQLGLSLAFLPEESL